MVRRRVLALAIAAAFATVSATAFAEQRGDQKNQPKRSKQEQQEIAQVVKVVDAVMAGEPAPGDIQMSLTPFFLKSQEQRTFVPFVLTVNGAPASDAALYIRVVNPAETPDPKAKKIEYPWDDIHFLSQAQVNAAQGRIHRVFMAPPGTYDVYVAMKERLPEKAPRDAQAKMGVRRAQDPGYRAGFLEWRSDDQQHHRCGQRQRADGDAEPRRSA
jgi:hypothetical protein